VVDGGFLASGSATERFNSVPPFAVRDLGRLPIRGRADGIDVVGIDDRNGAQETMAEKRKVYDQGGG
jgi:adenylate cyclase